MKIQLFALLALISVSSYAQTEQPIEVNLVESPEEIVQISEKSEVVTVNKSGEPTSILINKSSNPMVVGLGKDKRKAVVNGYIGYQTLLGANIGVEILDRLQIGAHAALSLALDDGRGRPFPGSRFAGIHTNLVIARVASFSGNQFSNPTNSKAGEFYIGARLDRYSQTAMKFHSYRGRLTGNTMSYVIGYTAYASKHSTVSFEVGIRKALNGGFIYQGDDIRWEDENAYAPGQKVVHPVAPRMTVSPVVNITLKYFIKPIRKNVNINWDEIKSKMQP